MRFSLERDFRVGKLPVSYYDGIVGAARCKKQPKACDLSQGVVTDDTARSVTFHLVAPDAEFLYKLALPFAYLVPAGTPIRDTSAHSASGTGPYVISRYRPNRDVTLTRNPYFREWSKAAQPDGYPDRLVYKIGVAFGPGCAAGAARANRRLREHPLGTVAGSSTDWRRGSRARRTRTPT